VAVDRSSEFGDTLAGCDRASLEAVIDRVWMSTGGQSMDSVPGAETLSIS